MTNKKVIPAIINLLPLPTPPDNLAHIHIFCNFAQNASAHAHVFGNR